MPIRRINYKKEQKQEQSRNDKLTAKILKQAELRDKLGTIEDLPLQTEYPESVFIPAAAEIKAAGSIGRGLLRTVGGLTLGNVGAKDLGRIGNTIDNTLNTKIFTPALGFVGGLGGYALGSGLTNAMIPRKVTYGPTDYRTTLADDQTPKYNSLQIDNVPKYQSPELRIGVDLEEPILNDLPDFSGVENLVKGNYGYNGSKVNVGKQSLLAEKRAMELYKSSIAENNRNASAIKWYGKPYSQLDVTQKYWLDVNHGGEFDPKAIIPRNQITVSNYQYPKPAKITEAERLGIPKSLRSNPKSLEDPYYWGYKQWTSRYNSAIESGNWDEAQRLRDLHFKVKAPNTKVVDENGMPLHMYHGLLDRISPDRAIKFNKYRGVNWDVEHAVENGSKKNHWKLAVPTDDIMANYHSPDYNMVSKSYALGHKDLIYDDYLNITNPFTYDKETIHNIINTFEPGYSTKTLKIEPAHYSSRPLKDSNGNYIKDSRGNIVWGDSKLIPERHYYKYSGVSDWAYFGASRKPLMQQGYDGLYIPQYYDSYGAFISPSQFKAADAITYDNTGKIIPIIKRDNFHNLDRRYKQGGTIE